MHAYLAKALEVFNMSPDSAAETWDKIMEKVGFNIMKCYRFSNINCNNIMTILLQFAGDVAWGIGRSLVV